MLPKGIDIITNYLHLAAINQGVALIDYALVVAASRESAREKVWEQMVKAYQISKEDLVEQGYNVEIKRVIV